jgi:hypothetical protein
MLVAMFAACRPAPSSQSLSGQSPSSQTQAASADQKQVTEAQKASSKPPLEFLLTSSADDFHTHHPPDPTGFRQVRLGHVVSGDGATQYMLCGEFLAAAEKGNAEWMYFATIKTSGYEQWLGAQARGLCEGSAVVWDSRDDLSSALQRQFDSLR